MLQDSSLPPIDDLDPRLLSVLLAAVREHAIAKDLPDPDQLAICQMAIDQGVYGDASWLDQKAQELKDSLDRSSSPSNTFKEVAIPKKKTITCQEDLVEVLAQHKLWQESVLDPNKEIIGGRADLSDQDISRYDLSYLDLRGVNLQNATLEETNLENSNLATAKLKGIKCYRTSFKNSSLRRADLTGASFISCNIEGADFSYAHLKLTTFEDTDKKKGKFSNEPKVEEALNQ
jgi:hypothetical protein